MISIGLDVGQRRDPTAICVADGVVQGQAVAPVGTARVDGMLTYSQDRTPTTVARLTYELRHIQRLPLDTPYPMVSRHVAGVVALLYKQTKEQATIYVDQTGHISFVEMLRGDLARIPHRLVPVTLTASDHKVERVHGGYEEWSVGKAWLVSRMQALLQTRRLRIPSGTREGKALTDELGIFQIKSTERHDEFGAYGSGKHDDLVIAAGLATMQDLPTSIGQVIGDEGRGGRWDAWM